MVNEIAAVLTARQLRELVQRLNVAGSASIDAEYELAALLGFSHIGRVTHAPDNLGAKRPDVLLRSECGELVADVTCVSQQSLTDREPARLLRDEFLRLIAQHGLPGTKFHLQIARTEEGEYRDRRVALTLPGNARIKQFLQKHVPILAEKISQRDKRQQYHIQESGMDVVVTYDPNGKGFGYGHLVVDVPYSLQRNAVHDALSRKARQLGDCNYPGPKGIVLCDAGARIIQPSHMAAPYTLGDIVNAFCKANSNISFVATLYAPQGGGRLTGQLWCNDHAAVKLTDDLRDLLTTVTRKLPPAERDGFNAQNWAGAHPGQGRSFFGGTEVMRDRVRISVRALQELLAGRVDRDSWLQRHGFIPDALGLAASNPFDEALAKGRLIASVDLERRPEEDDDWLTFHFGEPDPAISAIKAPRRSSLND
jgi:hypothetical protein